MATLGFFQPVDQPCPHKGSWDTKELCGFVLRTCGECGRTWAMVKLDDDTLAWEVIAEPEETQDVARVREIVQSVSSDEDEHGLLIEPHAEGRTRPPLQDVPEAVELDTAAGSDEEQIP